MEKPSLSAALQAASPMLLGMSQGLQNGNPMGGLQRGMVGMMALQERAKKEQAEKSLNETLRGMNIPDNQRAVLESMPMSMKQQYLMKMLQGGGVGRGGGGGRGSGGGGAVSPQGSPYAAFQTPAPQQGAQPMASAMQGAMAMAPSQELSFGTPVGAPAAPESPLAMAMATPVAMERPQLSFSEPEAAPVPDPVDPVDELKAKLADNERRRMAFANDPRSATTNGRRVAANLEDEGQILLAQLERAQPKIEEPKTIKGADGRHYFLTGEKAGQLVLPDVQVPSPKPEDEYGRYAAEERAAGREPFSRIDYAKAKKGKGTTVYGPDGKPMVEIDGGSGNAPKLTVDAAKNAGFLIRTRAANKILNDLEGQGTDFTQQNLDAVPLGLGNYFRGEEFQKFDQARRDFVNAILRRESGAVISDQEFDNANKQYFPVPGDGPEVIAQKRANRESAIAGLEIGSGDGKSFVDAQEAARDQPMDTPAIKIPEVPDFGTMSDDELDAYIAEMG